MSFSVRSYIALLILLLISCNNNTGFRRHLITDSDNPGIKYATRFNLQQKNSYKLLTIVNPWQGAVDVNQYYYLLGKGAPVPADADTNKIIRVPVNRIVCMSTTHLSMISALKETDAIKGISGSDYVYDRAILELVRDHRIFDVGYEDNLNKELLVRLSPELVMVYGIGGESTSYINKLKELGIKVLYNADYLETNPLGKAEWIKVFGALFQKENEADSIFSALSEEYNGIKSFVAKNITRKPSVFLGLPWKDTWFISPSNSYISKLISDAGGEYIWKDVKSEISMPFGIENVFMKAMKAEFWLNVSSVNSRDEIVSIDSRLKELPSFQADKIFNNNKRVSVNGGNDYWESGSVRPQVILKDIASILHPELFPGYQPCYYKRIE